MCSCTLLASALGQVHQAEADNLDLRSPVHHSAETFALRYALGRTRNQAAVSKAHAPATLTVLYGGRMLRTLQVFRDPRGASTRRGRSEAREGEKMPAYPAPSLPPAPSYPITPLPPPSQTVREMVQSNGPLPNTKDRSTGVKVVRTITKSAKKAHDEVAKARVKAAAAAAPSSPSDASNVDVQTPQHWLKLAADAGHPEASIRCEREGRSDVRCRRHILLLGSLRFARRVANTSVAFLSQP